MNRLFPTLTAASLAATGAFAGGIERSATPLAPLFEPGDYMEFSFGHVNPDVSGSAVPALGGFGSGEMTGSYATSAFAYKQQLSPQLAFGLFYDQPFGADVDYPAGTGYFAAGATAELDTHALTGLLKYTLPSNVSFYGGLRYQTLSASANVPFIPGGYSVDGDRDEGLGWMAGVAYERPEIALRVSLTYTSEIEHELDTSETSGLGIGNGSTTDITTPESWTLDFQSGVATDTLVFGSIRWTDWSEFLITPADYNAITGGSLVFYNGDITTYTLGVGRRFSDTWSGAVFASYEDQTGGFIGNLGPTDGRKSLGVSATWTKDAWKVTGGVSYIWLGDAETALPFLAPASSFEDNHAVAAGIRIGYSF